MKKIEGLTDEQLAPLLRESEHAFLPTKNHPDETASSLIEKFKNDPCYEVFGYVIDDAAITYITALSGREKDEIAIGPMFVTETSRGKGLGKQQVADFIQLFTERGYVSIYTKTWLGNAASRHAFESLGFMEIDRKDGDRVGSDSTISYVFRIS
jgi:GNAT superfamily N-acetyltransferase